jgi:hypothetical protein
MNIDDNTWLILLERIKSGRCTPFLGAGACVPAIPPGSTIAGNWARKYNYPGDNPKNLIEVAQYLAVEFDALFPKEKILQEVDSAVPPDFNADDEPHGLLADLPLPLYLTTNYDDFMVRALKSRNRDARRGRCWWHGWTDYNRWIEREPSVFDNGPPTVGDPVVFHLHGHTTPESIVLTEDDYLSFLYSISDPKLLPKEVAAALATNTILFIGYKLADWNFRVLFQGVAQSNRNVSIAVLLQSWPGDAFDVERLVRESNYLGHYYGKMDVKVYWGTARNFAAELRRRWDAFKAESGNA